MMTRSMRELNGRARRSTMGDIGRGMTAQELMGRLKKFSQSGSDSLAILDHWMGSTHLVFTQLLDRITPGQRSVLCSFLREPNDRSVARQLGLSESTVRNHLSIIETRLNAESREHLIAMCLASLMREAFSPETNGDEVT